GEDFGRVVDRVVDHREELLNARVGAPELGRLGPPAQVERGVADAAELVAQVVADERGHLLGEGRAEHPAERIGGVPPPRAFGELVGQGAQLGDQLLEVHRASLRLDSLRARAITRASSGISMGFRRQAYPPMLMSVCIIAGTEYPDIPMTRTVGS